MFTALCLQASPAHSLSPSLSLISHKAFSLNPTIGELQLPHLSTCHTKPSTPNKLLRFFFYHSFHSDLCVYTPKTVHPPVCHSVLNNLLHHLCLRLHHHVLLFLHILPQLLRRSNLRRRCVGGILRHCLHLIGRKVLVPHRIMLRKPPVAALLWVPYVDEDSSRVALRRVAG